jgi:hypothetical protein
MLLYLELASDAVLPGEDYEERHALPIIDQKINAEPVPPYNPSRLDCVHFDTLRVWITHCEQHHQEICSTGMHRGGVERVPDITRFRLIDCETGRIVFARLDILYVTLSYV